MVAGFDHISEAYVDAQKKAGEEVLKHHEDQSRIGANGRPSSDERAAERHPHEARP